MKIGGTFVLVNRVTVLCGLQILNSKTPFWGKQEERLCDVHYFNFLLFWKILTFPVFLLFSLEHTVHQDPFLFSFDPLLRSTAFPDCSHALLRPFLVACFRLPKLSCLLVFLVCWYFPWSFLLLRVTRVQSYAFRFPLPSPCISSRTLCKGLE